jgi:tetrahydromethanopterin S-methyltransferase subunit F
MAVTPIPQEKPMELEARIARVEFDVGHVRTDIAEIKTDVRDLRARMDTRFDTLTGKIDRLNDGISSGKVSGLLLYFALAGTLLGVMARGFGWI